MKNVTNLKMFSFMQSFPEWSQMNDCLELMMNLFESVVKQNEITFGPKFHVFVEKHPETIKESLQKIAEVIDREKESTKRYYLVHKEIKDELRKLKGMFDRIQADRKVANSVYGKAEKSEKKYQSEKIKLEDFTDKSSPEYSLQEDRIKKAEEQNSRDKDQKNASLDEMELKNSSYRNELLASILLSLKIISETRSETAAKIGSAGEEIARFADDIFSPDDISIQKLNSELEELDSIIEG